MTPTDDPAAQWRPHVEAWGNSGQSQAAYCREHDLVKSRFTYWKNKLRPAKPGIRDHSGSGFVPVRVLDNPVFGLTLRLPNGVAVEGVCGDNLHLAQQLASIWL